MDAETAPSPRGRLCLEATDDCVRWRASLLEHLHVPRAAATVATGAWPAKDKGCDKLQGEHEDQWSPFLAEMRRRVAPEASVVWCCAYEVLRVYEGEIWPMVSPTTSMESATGTSSLFSSLHIGREAAATVLALNHCLSSSARLNPFRRRWRWRAAAASPHFEGHCAAPWPEANNALYCHTPSNWFHVDGDDCGGGVVSGSKEWQVHRLWDWAVRGQSESSPCDIAKRLPHLVMASSAPDPGPVHTRTEHLMLLMLVTAIGMLRTTGVLCLLVPALLEELPADVETLLALLLAFFDRVELTMPEVSTPRAEEVYIVGTGFRGVEPALLKALVSSLRGLVRGKRHFLVSPDWVARIAPCILDRTLAWWRSARGAWRPPQDIDGYIGHFGLRRIPGPDHLLWSYCPELLRPEGFQLNKLEEGGCRPPAGERLVQIPLRGREIGLREEDEEEEEVDSDRRPAWPRKRMRTEVAQRLRRAPVWFVLSAEHPQHCVLRRHLRPDDSGSLVRAAQSGQWIRCSPAALASRIVSSLFADLSMLREPNATLRRDYASEDRRTTTEGAPPPPAGGDKDELPPALVVSLVHVLLHMLPERLSKSPETLTYCHGLHISGSSAAPLGIDSGGVAMWLSRRMGIETASVGAVLGPDRMEATSAEEFARLRLGFDDANAESCSSKCSFDLVLLETAGVASGHVASLLERPLVEMDRSWRLELLGAVLLGLRAAAPGGDLFLQLPSLYTRFLAGVVMALTAAFDRVAVMWVTGERWVVCRGLAAEAGHTHAVQKLIELWWDRCMSMPPGLVLTQVLPPGFLCAYGAWGSPRRFLCDANDNFIEEEKRRSAVGGDAGAGIEGSQTLSSGGLLLRSWTKTGAKPFLYPSASDRARVALFFGTFDPLHENHFRVAICALRDCRVRRVVLVPNQGGNPYKPFCASLTVRTRCASMRVRAAERAGDIMPGEIVVRPLEGGANNWPQREAEAQRVEMEELADTKTTVEAVLVLGEDSFLKSLDQAKKHKNSGIFQEQGRSRRIILFPRLGSTDDLMAKVPERLRPWVEVAPYSDLVHGLSSSSVREQLRKGGPQPPPEALHPSIWETLRAAASPPLESQCPEVSSSHTIQPASRDDKVVDAEDTRSHYNRRAWSSSGCADGRQTSPTVRLRNFNSFAKAVLLERFLGTLQGPAVEDGAAADLCMDVICIEGGARSMSLPTASMPLSVLDLGCGRGGDLRKMVNGGVSEYCGVDVAEGALEALLGRARQAVEDSQRARHGRLGEDGLVLREVSLVCADCCRTSLATALDSRVRHATARLQHLGQTWFHLVSSQMACHYAFDSEVSVEMLLRNVSERLCNGGFFVGTLPNAAQIVRAQREAWERRGELRTGNELFEVLFEPAQWARVAEDFLQWQALDKPGRDVFGITYRYSLVDAVDGCSEPLAHFGTFREMARKHDLTVCMEPTPLLDIVGVHGEAGARADAGRLRRVYFYKGGMDCTGLPCEREALGLYIAFAFRKDAPAERGAMSCERLTENLRQLHYAEGDAVRLPRGKEDIVHLDLL